QGSVVLTATASLPGNVYLGSTKEYNVLPDPIGLVFKLDNVPSYTSEDIAAGTAGSITLSVRNEETRENLSAEEWEATELVVHNDDGIDWAIEKGSEPGTWVLTPSAEDISGIVESHSLEFDVEATYQIGDQHAHGIAHESIEADITLLDIIKYYAIRIAIISAIAFFVLGHIFKKRLDLKGVVGYNYSAHGDQSPRREVRKSILRVILPWLAERAHLAVLNPNCQCDCPNLTIEATGKGSCRIVNYKSVTLDRTKIGTRTFKMTKNGKNPLKEATFNVAGFKVISLDAQGRERGSFRLIRDRKNRRARR
ncbi:MAG: hypothetical protein Q4D39_00125, partial [Coriobacteriaceae bacterium]|nr:hypothetical protein [Coriobacteriaceae bacterium]